MGSKLERQNQHQRRLTMKIARHKKRGWNTDGLEKELAYSTGDKARSESATGRDSDPRYKKGHI
jgi:hypothetical protein